MSLLYADLRAKYDFQKRQYMEALSQLRTTSEQLKKSQTPPTSPGGSSSSAAFKRKIAELEEERTIITTQLHTYKVYIVYMECIFYVCMCVYVMSWFRGLCVLYIYIYIYITTLLMREF